MAKPRSYKSPIGEATVSELKENGKPAYFIEVDLDTPMTGLTKAKAVQHLQRLNKWVDEAIIWLQKRP